MKKSHGVLLLSVAAAVAGILVYRKYRAAKLAQAHPLLLPSDASLLKPLPVDVSLVTDTNLIT